MARIDKRTVHKEKLPWTKGEDREGYRREAGVGLMAGKWQLITTQNLKLQVAFLKLAMTEPGF